MYDAGGKGINVSKTIHALGGVSLATGFLGNDGSSKIIECLAKEKIHHDFVMIDGITRTNTKVIEANGTLTELNEQGMFVPPEKLQELEGRLEAYAEKGVLFVLAGSIPAGVDTDVYARITNKVKAKGAEVLVDADGELFVKALQAAPSIVKPNQVELAEYFGCKQEMDEEQIIIYADKLLDMGIHLVAVSRGSQGAIFVTREYTSVCKGYKVKAHSSVGAGDAMVAALAYGFDKKSMELKEIISMAMATSAGAVTTIGTKPPSKELVEQLMMEDVCSVKRRNS